MIPIEDHAIHALLIISLLGAVAVILRILVARTRGRNWTTEIFGCFGIVALLIALMLLVLVEQE